MRRTLTISFVALVLVFGATACGEEGADQQVEELQQQVEEQQQQIEEQQQRIQELEESIPPGAIPTPEEPTTQSRTERTQ